MTANERRIAPRKDCVVPVRFRILSHEKSHHTEEYAEGAARVATMRVRKADTKARVLEGEAVNLSERGICILSHEDLAVGDILEVYLTLPWELTGRRTEELRCKASVVHVDSKADLHGKRAIGASIERFEAVARLRSWAN